MRREEDGVYLIAPGGTSHVVTLGGAVYAVDALANVYGIAGTSAGGLNALAYAFGVQAKELLKLYQDLLQTDRILDRSIFAASAYGLCKFDTIRTALNRLLGANARLGDALIPLILVVTDAHTGRPVYLSSEKTPKVMCSEAGTATASLVPLSRMQFMPSLVPGRLYYDGGFTDNCPDHVFEDRPHKTLILDLQVDHEDDAIPIHNAMDAAKSVARSLTYAQSAKKNTRTDTVTVPVPVRGSGFDFSLTPDVSAKRWMDGARAVLNHPWAKTVR